MLIRSFGAVLALLVVTGCARQPRPFLDASRRIVPGSIDRAEMLEIGGEKQAVRYRGRDSTATPLILLHGGPGISTSALFRHFVPEVEDSFLVVYWDQRGAGRSYRSGMPPETMTIQRMERDLDELVDAVRGRFSAERVVLLGHSWGTILGTRYAHQHPQKVALYIGVAQIADFDRGKRVSLRWARERARERNDGRSLERLEAMAPSPGSVSDELELGRLVERYGGMSRGGLDTRRLIWTAMRSPDTSLADLWRFGAGNRFSLRALRDEYSREDLTRLSEFQVPVLFLLGSHDWHIPTVEGMRYFDLIQAPCKRLVLFPEAAHNPPFEQPRVFLTALFHLALPMAREHCPD